MTAVRPTSATRRSSPRGRCLGLLFLVLGGLFAMHGLGIHGAATVDAMPAMTPDAHPTAAADPAPRTSMPAMAPARPAAILSVLSAVPSDDSRAMAGMAGMCLAVLVGLGLGLLALRRPTAVVGVPVPLAPPRPARAGRDCDPPSLHALSVHRC